MNMYHIVDLDARDFIVLASSKREAARLLLGQTDAEACSVEDLDIVQLSSVIEITAEPKIR